MTAKYLSVVDYIIFSLSLVVSLAIGFYYAIKGRKTNEEFLMGNRKMPIVPVAFSLLASFLSAIGTLGIPAEVYTHGAQFWLTMIGQVLCILLSTFFFLPVFFKARKTSVYEFLEDRFQSKALHIISSVSFIVQMMLYLAVVIYAPALAIASVTGFPTWASIVCTGLIGTAYTSLGGLKAVIWTDSFQLVIMLCGVFSIIIQGSIEVGGMAEMWRIAKEGGRLDMFDFNPNPFMYQNFWALTLGSMIYWLTFYGVNQIQVQRYCSIKTMKEAQIAALINFPGLIIMTSVYSICGIAVFAVYHNCDPLKAKLIQSRDEIVPYFVMEYLTYLPGIPGLFLACLFCGTMSTISSALNSLAAVTWENTLKKRFKHLNERKANYITKITAASYGLLAIILVQVATTFQGLIQASFNLNGVINGPLFGVFLLALFIPWSNRKGAIAGIICSYILSLWIAIGAWILKPHNDVLPSSIEGCMEKNITLPEIYNVTFNKFTSIEAIGNNSLNLIPYSLSHYWLTSFGATVVVIVGCVVSFFTGATRLEDINPDFLSPLVLFCLQKRLKKISELKKYGQEDSIPLKKFEKEEKSTYK